TLTDEIIPANQTKLIILDLDLFSPSKFVLEKLSNKLSSGDLVYFDEAFDSAERILVQEYFLKTFSAKPLCASPFGIVYEVI
ncbi:MAG: hypothetical protein EB100_07680, partial [Crocinitomicaceae bacterium]|nr:hypothetical protein [Crocinitomicaceae bacterium]